MRRPPTPLLFHAIALLAAYLAALWLYLDRVPGTPGGLALASWLLLPLAELAAYVLLGSALLRGARGSRWRLPAFAALALLVTLAWLAQLAALVIGNAYISVLALENAEHARLTADHGQWRLMAAGVAAWGIVVAFAWHGRQASQRGNAGVGAKAWPLLAAAGLCAVVVVANARVDDAGGTVRLLPGQSPLAALARTGSDWFSGQEAGESPPGMLAAAHATGTDAGNACGNIPATGDWPLLRERVAKVPLPFASDDDAPDRPNIIVLFAEGTSSRLLEAYGGRYPGLTPNISRMAARSMVVDDYFNHTAATFRGLQGQMSSGFPRHGGAEKGSGWTEKDNATAYEKKSYATVSRILHDRGYHTAFFSPHPARDALTRLIAMLGFDEVYTLERSRALLGSLGPLNRGSLTDRDLFRAVRTFLEQRPPDAAPVFVATYNIGTHAFLDSPPGAKKYGDGGNISLNTLHEFDAEFGRFYDWFIQSRHADDTLLVLTSDHAHYPEPPYVEVAGDDLAPYFVDRIPLLVHAPWLDLPARYDARGRTSLDFAPTLLQLAGVQDARNSFVGRTLFNPAADKPLQVAAIGTSLYAIEDGRVKPAAKVSPGLAGVVADCRAWVERYYALERRNRIFPPL
ncbi:LTA synthase family protein [Cognatiluteimonas lumbrici]|uniref:LTA synthase family protein n=1 Tax=Cognatiluteimonas lumbrici TaxID=2559601 RepID=UPI00112E4D62|nr:LTA synthase family protein [Luteimonas lumbrici]